jgi:outer membrane protein assembly factor BamB
MLACFHLPLAVVPVFVGPMQVLLAILPGILLALGTLLLSLLRPRVMKQALLVAWRVKFSLLAIVLAAVGLFFGVRALVPTALGSASQAQSGSGDWPLFRGGLTRRGYVAGDAEPATAGVVWVHRKSSEGFFSSPAVVGNRVYVASAELGAFSSTGAIYCFDADTGAVVWRSAPDDYQPTFSSPAIWRNYLVCGEGLHDTQNARVICLDISPQGAGRVLWTHETKSHVECTPVIADGRVFVGAGDDGYYCLHLAPQPAGKKQLIWHRPGERNPDAETSLVAYDGMVFAGLGVGGRQLLMMDAATGQSQKRLDTPYPVFSPPAIANGKLYIGMGNGDYVHTAEEAAEIELAKMKDAGADEAKLAAARKLLAPAGEVWCIDLKSLAVDWKCKLARTVLGSVAVGEDVIYAGSRDGKLTMISRDGRVLESFDTHDPLIASPALGERHVYVVTDGGRLYALDRRTLEPVWEMAVGSQPMCVSSPTVARGHVYVGTQHDGLLCVGQPASASDEPQIDVWAGPHGGPGVGGCTDDSPLASESISGVILESKSEAADDPPEFMAPAAAAGNAIVFPIAGGDMRGLACLEAAAPRIRWKFAAETGVWSSPVIVGEAALCVSGRPSDAQRELICLDIATGQPRWRLPIATGASGALTGYADGMLVQHQANAIEYLDLAGKRVWQTEIGPTDRAAFITPAMIALSVVTPPQVVVLDRQSGRVLCRRSLKAPPTTSPLVRKNFVFVGTDKGLQRVSIIGDSKAPHPGPLPWGEGEESDAVASELVLLRGRVAYVSQRGELQIVSLEDGRIVRSAAGVLPHLTPLRSRDALLFAATDGLLLWRPDDENAEPELWLELGDAGPPTSSPILHASQLYVGTRAGLVKAGAGP